MAQLCLNAHQAEITNRNVAQVLQNDIVLFGSLSDNCFCYPISQMQTDSEVIYTTLIVLPLLL